MIPLSEPWLWVGWDDLSPEQVSAEELLLGRAGQAVGTRCRGAGTSLLSDPTAQGGSIPTPLTQWPLLCPAETGGEKQIKLQSGGLSSPVRSGRCWQRFDHRPRS